MADVIEITLKAARHTDVDKQDLRLAVDVAAYDELDLLLTVQEDVGGSGVDVKILTSMQRESDDGWVTAATFDTTAANGASKRNVQGFLRYVRYELTTATTTTFLISGMGRRWA